MDGLLIIDKPAGPTSHDVVARARRALGERRIGHTGTLDPMASGVLPLVLGRATRLARFLSGDDKIYEAELRLGVATDTYDAQGAPAAAPHAGPLPSREEIDRALDAFRGVFMQQPPPYSAKKIGGRRSYALARAASRAGGRDDAGGPVAAAPAPVTVTTRSVELVDVQRDTVRLRVACSAGFYIRSLAHDLGIRLGTGAHLTALRRTRAGDCTLEGALPLGQLERDPTAAAAAVIPLAAMLPRLPAAILTEQGERLVAHGRDVGPADVQQLRGAEGGACAGIRLLDREGRLLAVADRAPGSGVLHPSVVLM